MKLAKLTLKQFRNLEPLTLEPHENLNLIVGLNASGKTNLCEALYYASRGRLLKGERQRELIRWDCHWSTLRLKVGEENIRILLDGVEAGKTVELGGEVVNQRDIFEVFPVLIFTPDELQVIKGSPAKRRRMLDSAIADLDGAYRHKLLVYEQVVRRKNALLRKDRPDEALLDVYNQKLSALGGQLVARRFAHLADLNEHLQRTHRRLNQAGAGMELRYDSDVDYGEGASDAAQAAALAAACANAAARERERRVSLIGPHRDDVWFDLEQVDLRRYGSQGQQKTALISLKLAELALFHKARGAYPVLVLDDVLSELDPERTQLLLDHLPQDLQLFLTETALSPALLRRAGKVFRVEQGRVCELSDTQRAVQDEGAPQGTG